MSEPLGFSNQTIQVFAYEGFNYVVSNPDPLSTLNTVSNSAGLNPESLYFTKNGNDSYTFQVSDLGNKLAAGTTESFTLTNTAPRSAAYTVAVNPGRFLDASGGDPLLGQSFTFFKNEPITRIQIVAPSFDLKPPTSVPTLPPGITFERVDSNIYDISGIPLVTVPNSNYLLIGVESGGSKVVTTRINMAISNERVQLSLDGTPVISNMIDGVAIEPRTLTAVLPQGASQLRYRFPTFPNGIVVTDISGTLQTSPFTPVDASFTMVISGTPTLAAAEEFRAAGATSTGLVYTVQASRISPLPLIENTQQFQFAFGETVLFNAFTIPPLYVGVPITPVDVSGETYFSTSTPAPPIASIVSPDLGFGLNLSFNPITSLAQLSGTPNVAGSSLTTFRATNSNGITRDIVKSINVSNDSVTFSSPTDLSYTFILSRPVDQFKPGFYESNIQFATTVASGREVILSADALVGTGLSLDSNGFIVGIPTQITPSTALDVVATVSGSPATATKTVTFEIVDDAFTFTDIPSSNFNFIENVPITPFSVSVTTLSGRNVVGFSQTGFPSGLSINPAGVLAGTITTNDPSSGNLTVIATTGFSSGSNVYAYTIQPDAILIVAPQSSYKFAPSDPIDIQIEATAYSGRTVSNFSLDLVPSYGLNIGSTSGNITGAWIDGLPPNLLPASCNFAIRCEAGQVDASLSGVITTDPVIINAVLFTRFDPIAGGDGSYSNEVYYTSVDNLSTWNNAPQEAGGLLELEGAISDLQVKSSTGLYDNVILGVVNSIPLKVLRATNLSGFSEVPLPFLSNVDPETTIRASAIIHKPSTSTWWLVGTQQNTGTGSNMPILISSLDDGLTWGQSGLISIQTSTSNRVLPRDDSGLGSGTPSGAKVPYLLGGFAGKYKDGVILVGGLLDGEDLDATTSMLRSTDDGLTWSNVSGAFGIETAYFSLDNSSTWIATGSSLYKSLDIVTGTYDFDTVTIKYSTDQGQTWSNASGQFNRFGYEVAHGGNTWLATGIDKDGSDFLINLRFSTDGSNWAVADLSSTNLFGALSAPVSAALPLGSMRFDGTHWNVFVHRQDPVLTETYYTEMYRHDVVSSLASNWTRVDLSGSYFPEGNARFLTLTQPEYIISGDGTIEITLSFPSQELPGGPTITSPTQTSYLLYQYIPITPIQLEATGTGIVYFFVEADALPPGLTFNPRTNRLSGTPAQIGTTSITIYAKDDVGTTEFSLSFTVIIPRIIRKQEGAGAYTSLLRQYTEVLGAQGARDNRALPNQERALGEFMSPEGPEVVTQSNECCRT